MHITFLLSGAEFRERCAATNLRGTTYMLNTDFNKMVREPNVSPHKQIVKDDDVKECISIE